MTKGSFVLALLLLVGNSPPSQASFASELLACKWSDDEYLLLRASLPRSGPGYYFVESVTAAGKQEVARFEDAQMQLLHSAIGGSTYQPLSSVYFLNDGKRQFLAHFIWSKSAEVGDDLWFVDLPGYRTGAMGKTSCMYCDMDNNYCRDIF